MVLVTGAASDIGRAMALPAAREDPTATATWSTVRHLGDQDASTSDLLKQFLAVEEEHADELADLFEGLPVDGG